MNEALMYFCIVINIITFLVFGYDKWQAKTIKDAFRNSIYFY